MSDSEISSEDEKVEEQETESRIDVHKLPRRFRSRYWTSWEEMLLIEQWRKYFDQVTHLDKHLPVFRIISNGMKESGFHVTGAEVRRKIKAIKNKYIEEQRRLNECGDENAKSEWRLYHLVHCLMKTPANKYDPFHEEKALKNVLERLKSDPLYHIIASGMPVASTLQRITAGEQVQIPLPAKFPPSFPVENKTIADCIAYSYENKTKRSYTPKVPRPCELTSTQLKTLTGRTVIDSTKSHLLPPEIPSNAASSKAIPQCGGGGGGSGPLKRLATEEAIKQMRQENMKLIEECVISKRRLKMEEQQLKAYEKLIEQIHAQYEFLFQHLRAS